MENPFAAIDSRLRRLEEMLSEIFESNGKTEASDDIFINKKETAQMLGVSVATVDNLKRGGKIPYVKIGSNVRFKKSEVIAAIGQLNPQRRES